MTINAKARLKIIIIWISILALGIGLILYNLDQNISFFYTPEEIYNYAQSGKIKQGEIIRIGGLVKPSSFVRLQEAKFRFVITDGTRELTVHYEGALPNLFKENQTVVATGKYYNSTLIASEILAKHDENYRPPKLNNL
jgi:cytochrome c-type biogenesis protein CcmE